VTKAFFIGLALTTATAAAAQQPAGSPASAQAKPAQPPATGSAQQPAEAPEPQGYAYNAEGRRDPFVSLLRRGTETDRAAAALRPAGLSGLMTAEVTLTGTLQSRSGFVAMLRGVDNKTYIVRPGDKLLDGTIRAITVNTMVILQQVNDPLSLEKQREVRKLLRQTEEVR
jgi:hypothetical protein